MVASNEFEGIVKNKNTGNVLITIHYITKNIKIED